MAQTTLKRVPGIALLVKNDTTTIPAWEDLSVDAEGDVADATAASSLWEQLVMTRKKGSGQLSGFLGSEFPMLAIGDEFKLAWADTSGGDVSTAMANLKTAPGKCRVTKVSDKGNKDPGKTTVSFRWGFID